MLNRITPARLALATLGIGLLLTFTPTPVHAQDHYRGDILDARQHGYEHGYRDGYEYGRDARARNVALDYRTDVYRDADRGYRPFFGSRDEYRGGYRDGYRDGATDAYDGNRSRLERMFAARDRGEEERQTVIYRERHWDYQDVASDIGYRDGVNAGLHDFREHHSYRATQHDAWRDADHGYNNAFGSKDEYRRAYRVAFENGYRDGFGMR